MDHCESPSATSTGKGTFLQKVSGNLDIIAILIFAAIIRFPGILHGLPAYHMPIEYDIIDASIKILKGNLHPHWIFYYGGFYYYINAVLIGFVHIIYHSLHFLGLIESASTPYWLFFAVARSLNILFCLVLIWTSFCLAYRMGNRSTGIFASIIMALLPLPYLYSIRVAPDMLCVTLAAISIYFSYRHLMESKSNRWLWWAAISSGLAVATKYMFLSVVPFLTAKFIRDHKNNMRFWDIRLLKAFFLAILAFIIVHPFSILSFHEFFFEGVFFEHKTHFPNYHFIFEKPITAFLFIRDLFFNGVTPSVFIVSIIGMIYCAKKRINTFLVISLGPSLWFLLLSSYKLPFTHNIMIVLLPMAVCSGIVVDKIKFRKLKFTLLVLVCIPPLLKDLHNLKHHMKKDIRYVAQEWVNENLPAGSWVAREEYTPFVDEEKFTCTYLDICGLSYMSVDSVRNAGYDYIISASHDRFLSNPKKHAEEIENYNNMLREFEIIKEFDPGQKYRGSKMLILKIK